MKTLHFLFLLFSLNTFTFSQGLFPHPHAHSHNDYERIRPLKNALQNGFISVEADVHLQNGNLLVSHHHPNKKAPSLEKLYLAPLDSLLHANSGQVYRGYAGPFYLMIDCKTEARTTYRSIRNLIAKFPALLCSSGNCPVKIFLSGNRPVQEMVSEGYSGIGIDGRPNDLGKGYSSELMPVISDHFRNWSTWNGKSKPSQDDLMRIKGLVQRVHAEGKKLRLWAIPDHEETWTALLEAGVDFINTDHLQELNHFLTRNRL